MKITSPHDTRPTASALTTVPRTTVFAKTAVLAKTTLLGTALMSLLLMSIPLMSTAVAKTAPLPTLSVPPALNYQTGLINVLGGKVQVQANSGLRYLDADDARKVIVDLWGNRPEAAEDVIGMLVPANTRPDAENGWAIVMTENRDGHISDSDAAKTDYAELMSNMQAGTEENNADRKKAGYEPVTLIGWAEPPSYDAAQHKMIWAKELAFGTVADSEHTLNYAVRVLGRDSVLELNAVGSLTQLTQIKQGMKAVLPMVTFAPGSRYSDFKEGSDKLAGYGLAGLIAGGLVAKKVGFLALLPLILKKGWIVILLLLGLLGRLKPFFQNLFAGRRTTQPSTQPSPAAAGGPSPASSGGMPTVHPDLAHRPSKIDISKPGDSSKPLGRHSGND